MAIFHQSSTMVSTKILFISTTIISLAISLKLYAPPITDISISFPSLYDGVVSWLKPPYLYLVINCIIITIVASSKFEHLSSTSPPPQLHQSHVQVQPIIKTSLKTPISQLEGVFTPLTHQFDEMFFNNNSNKSALTNDSYVDAEAETEFTTVDTAASQGEIDMKLINEFVISKSVSKAVGKEYSVRSAEKPPAATRFGHHRKTVKSSPQGGKMGLRVSKPRRQDTLESTWKTITEGRAMPLTRHLKKSDTWETHGRHHHNLDNELHKMTKSETFSDRSEATSPPLRGAHTPAGKLKKEPSLGQDDLNKRVEAFIKKFNEDMRLQRQESLNHYMEMINRGAH